VVEINTSAAAERNKQPIAAELQTILAAGDKVLEIASGTGQHIAHFGEAFPLVHWQPTDATAADFHSIASHCTAASLNNVAMPVELNVLSTLWNVARDFQVVLCINMIHISPWETTAALFLGAGRHLADTGVGHVVLYGPFREGGEHTAASNAEFEKWLKAKDSRFGVRNLQDVDAVAQTASFARQSLTRMPANNLLLRYTRTA
jgi:cyclopropane fatty-acyl-phospholipid synthase-like methyltransferase